MKILMSKDLAIFHQTIFFAKLSLRRSLESPSRKQSHDQIFFPFLLFPFGFAVIARYQKKFCIQNFFFLMTSSMLRTKWLNFFVGSAAIVPHLSSAREFLQNMKMVFQMSWNDFRNFLKRKREGELHLFLITLYRQSDRRQVHLIGLNCTHRIAASGPGTLKENPYRTRTKTLHC